MHMHLLSRAGFSDIESDTIQTMGNVVLYSHVLSQFFAIIIKEFLHPTKEVLYTIIQLRIIMPNKNTSI